MSTILSIHSLYVYPIKSLAGVSLSQAKVEEQGFELDRRWMLVDEEGRFLSQRTLPGMATIKVEIGDHSLDVFVSSRPEDRIRVPLHAVGEEISVKVWDDEMLARLVDPQIDAWFSQKLGVKARLVHMSSPKARKVDPRYAVNEESVSFADGMPYLIIGEESLNDLNSRLEFPVSMDRFRPNIVFSGGTPFQEDSFQRIKIGEIDFQLVKPCARCVMITVDQQSGSKGKEPLKTLATYRTKNKKIYFGQNMVALSSGKLRVGDLIQVS
ncbi:MOSC domain-containing protein [Algoriphagus sp. NG3]|uniref:MOSC domain-containing protein n=1 Tax=Algoriphagus sp. NG3 TaxID=3097546 RepID=UPI002A7F9A6D|nr:MOSC N-terminal beta barrel domain-containing protein [Algoriphagus sp. NG3]WPR74203.1 MOSC domain-containing protein [Algoriphagus sp. NG3]